MKNMKNISHFGFIGFGLIGGSIAHSLRELYPDSKITAYNYYKTTEHPRLNTAKSDGILTDISTSLEDMGKCDVIFLCAPVLTNIAYLNELAPYLSEDCLLTDVGSVKGNIHREVQKLGLTKQFVGGHPMTGSEKTGYGNSSSDYLKGAYYILTPENDTFSQYTEWLADFVKKSGSHCEIMDYETHDCITAAISHGPHVISASLVNTVASLDTSGQYAKLAAGGLKDITRISSSSPEMWQNICLANPACIVNFLDNYIATLTQMKNDIEAGNEEKLTQFFESAKNYRDNLK